MNLASPVKSSILQFVMVPSIIIQLPFDATIPFTYFIMPFFFDKRNAHYRNKWF